MPEPGEDDGSRFPEAGWYGDELRGAGLGGCAAREAALIIVGLVARRRLEVGIKGHGPLLVFRKGDFLPIGARRQDMRKAKAYASYAGMPGGWQVNS